MIALRNYSIISYVGYDLYISLACLYILLENI